MTSRIPIPALPPEVQVVLSTWPDTAQRHLLAIRDILFDVAAQSDVGALDESLKWGQPAWRPRAPRTGSTLRFGWSAQNPAALMAFVNCRTDLAGQMSTRFPNAYDNDGRRSLAFDLATPLPDPAIRTLAHLTFTYLRPRTEP